MIKNFWRLTIWFSFLVVPALFLLTVTAHANVTPVGDEFQVNSYEDDRQSDLSIAPLANGGFVIIWSSLGRDGSGSSIYGRRFDSSCHPVSEEFQINSYTRGGQHSSSTASLNDGGFLVTWTSETQDGSFGSIYGRRYNSSGHPVSEEFQINTYTTSDQNHPSVSSLSNGGFVVTWSSYGPDGSAFGVFGQIFDSSSNPVGGEFQVNSFPEGVQYRPSVTSLSTGGFVVVWISADQDGSDDGIYGQRFDSSGIPAGDEFQVNSHTTGDQVFPSIVSIRDGGFVVTWSSYDQDGYDRGIYGQCFDSSGSPSGDEFLAISYIGLGHSPHSTTPLPNGGFLLICPSGLYGGSYPLSNYDLIGQRFDSFARFIGDNFNIHSFSSNDFPFYSVGSLTNEFLATWCSHDELDNWHIYGQRFRIDDVKDGGCGGGCFIDLFLK